MNTVENLWNNYATLHRKDPSPFSNDKIGFYKANSDRTSIAERSPTIAIVIPAYNEQVLLPRTLASVNDALRNTTEPTVTVVVDNASTDATREVAQQFGVRIIEEPRKGIGAARQAGLLSLPGSVQYVLTTDADTVVPHAWIGLKHQALKEDAVYPLVYGYLTFKFDFPPKFGLLMRFGVYKMCGLPIKLLMKMKSISTSVALGCNMAFRKDPAIAVGGYNETLVDGEDENLRQRLGGKFLPDIKVITSRRRQEGTGFLMWGSTVARSVIQRYMQSTYRGKFARRLVEQPEERRDFR